jgi:hypothetical protein
MSPASMEAAQSEAKETEALGIVEPAGDVFGIEHHRRRGDRPGERPAPGLVGTGDRPQPFAAGRVLQREIWPDRKVEE